MSGGGGVGGERTRVHVHVIYDVKRGTEGVQNRGSLYTKLRHTSESDLHGFV